MAQERVAVITGAAGGIGFAVAERLAREGVTLVLADINQAGLEAAERRILEIGGQVTSVVTDVSSADSVRALADSVYGKHEAVDFLFNNAGVEGYLNGPLWQAGSNDWNWTFGVNFWGVVNGIHEFVPRMVERDKGHIINTASAAGFVVPSAMYSITKNAVVSLSELLYVELAQRDSNVRVTVLCPGEVDTGAAYGIKNRPPRYADSVAEWQAGAGAAVRAQMATRRGHPEAKTPAQAADLLYDAVLANQFYVFTDNVWDPRIKRRFENILERRNPALPDDPVALAILQTIRSQQPPRHP